MILLLALGQALGQALGRRGDSSASYPSSPLISNSNPYHEVTTGTASFLLLVLSFVSWTFAAQMQLVVIQPQVPTSSLYLERLY